MIHAMAEKSVVVLKPVSVATNATQTGQIDRAGFDYLTIDVVLDSQASTTSKPAVLKLGEADVTNTSSAVDIPAFTGGTSVTATTGFVIPNSGSAATVVRFNVDCRARKRYLLFSVTSADAAQLTAAAATLRRAKIAPTTDAEKGAAEVVTG